MEYETFDNDTASDAEYSQFVEWLSEHVAVELRDAQGDAHQQKMVLCRYYKRGLKANLTAAELIDFLGVSTPSILDRAGFTDEEGDTLMAISDRLTEAEIEAVE